MGIEGSKKLTQFFIQSGVVKEEERDVYQYCFEVLFSVSSSMLLILLVGAVSGRIAETILYLLGFWPIRLFAGGYHAKTPLGCLALTTAFYLLFLGTVFIGYYSTGVTAGAMTILAFLTIYAVPSVVHENKPIGAEQRKELKRKSRLAAGLIVVGVLGLLAFQNGTIFGYSLSAGLSVAAVSLVMAQLDHVSKERRKRNV